jgi:hypothetical protein
VTTYTYAVESWVPDGPDHMAWVPDPGFTGTRDYPGTAAQLARRMLNGYIADVASDAGLPVGTPGAGPIAMTRVIVWRGHGRDKARNAAAVLSHNDDADRVSRRSGRPPLLQGFHELGTWTIVQDAARDIARRLTGNPDKFPFFRDVMIVDPNDIEPGDAFLEAGTPATGGFWAHIKRDSFKVWLHVQVTLLPDQDIAQAEMLLDDQRRS